MRSWRNWQTHPAQNRTGNTVGVQLPPIAPLDMRKWRNGRRTGFKLRRVKP